MKRTWLIVSVVAHLGLLGAYVVHGMWQIEKVTFERPPVQLAAMSPMAVEDPMAGLEPGAKPKAPEPPKPQTKVVVDDLAQPKPDVTPDPATTATTSTTTDANTPPGGGGIPGTKLTSGTGQPCLDPAGCETDTTPKCRGDACLPEQPPFVPPRELRKKLIAGETQIVPDHPTKIALQRAGKDRVIGVVKYCIDTGGNVTSAQLERSTGYPAYDARLVDGVRAWKFRPHTIGTTPIGACSTVNFDFQMK
jgi:TonB family protein